MIIIGWLYQYISNAFQNIPVESYRHLPIDSPQSGPHVVRRLSSLAKQLPRKDTELPAAAIEKCWIFLAKMVIYPAEMWCYL